MLSGSIRRASNRTYLGFCWIGVRIGEVPSRHGNRLVRDAPPNCALEWRRRCCATVPERAGVAGFPVGIIRLLLVSSRNFPFAARSSSRPVGAGGVVPGRQRAREGVRPPRSRAGEFRGELLRRDRLGPGIPSTQVPPDGHPHTEQPRDGHQDVGYPACVDRKHYGNEAEPGEVHRESCHA